MGRIILLLLLISGSLHAQPPGYTKINARYQWLAGAFGDGLHVPQYNGVPTDRTGVWMADGAVAQDTLNGHFYYRHNGTWVRVAKFSDIAAGLVNIYNSNGTLSGNRTVNMGTHDLAFTNGGNIGINNASPGYNLDVAGTFQALDGTTKIQASGTRWTVGDEDDDAFSFVGGNTSTQEAQLTTAAGATTVYLAGIPGDIDINATSGTISLHDSSAATASNGYVWTLQDNTSGVGAWKAATGAPTPISSLTAATGTNDINNADFTQTWRWNSLSSIGLDLQSNSTAADNNESTVLNIETTGVNANSAQATYGAQIRNTHSGSSSNNYGLYTLVSGGASANIGAWINSSGTGAVALQLGTPGTSLGNLVMSGNTSGAVTIQPAAAAGTPTLTLPIVTGTLVQYVNTTTASDATPDPTGDAKENNFSITALAADATFSAPSGTPSAFNTLLIRVKDNSTVRALAWNAIYRAGTDIALPTTTVDDLTMYIYFVYNSTDSKWDLVGLTTGF